MIRDTIREMMAAERMSQSYLGLILGINQSAVAGMLNRDMSAKRFIQVCDAMGYEVIARKGDKEYGFKPSDIR